ncbi:hypothetical protein CDD81_160 [Ophiocordyceps australis]|uniref:Thioredoxin domain-containing protein n=1 Tax=Ophiocordyceps australis TaxID=1399860 RepID=A0A2C5YIR9_9HYPO|nr:hypothetical protein CDD81_160 [Ophiocordyceps australis]
MRLLAALASACALYTSTVTAAKSPQQRFNDFKHLEQTTVKGPLVLNDASFQAMTAAPRDFAAAVLLTAKDPRFGCAMCREIQPEWELLGRSWANGDKQGEARMLFATIDFADARDTFVSLGLQTAPVLFFYPPTEGPHATTRTEPIRYDFTTGTPSAEQIHNWIARHLPGRPHPPVSRPFNYLRLASTVTLLLGLATLSYSAGPYILPLVQNRNIWAAGTMIAIVLFISGHMFNHIRHVPYVTGDGRGGITYFSNGFQSQLGLETQIIAAIYGLLTFCTIGLTTRVPRMSSPQNQLIASLSWLVVMYLLNSFLLRVFRIKNNGYPFSLPPFM